MAEESSSEKTARLERRLLEEVVRGNKRQVAPFSRQKPKATPEQPGLKSGKDYGRRCRRSIPEKVDEVIEVPLLQPVRIVVGR